MQRNGSANCDSHLSLLLLRLCDSPLRPLPRCPNPGRGRSRNMWDYSQLMKFTTSGERDSDDLVKEPMCKVDFLDHFENKAPSWQRFLEK